MTPSLRLSPPSPATTESPLCGCVQGVAVPRRPGYSSSKICGGTFLHEERQKNCFFPKNVCWGSPWGGLIDVLSSFDSLGWAEWPG